MKSYFEFINEISILGLPYVPKCTTPLSDEGDWKRGRWEVKRKERHGIIKSYNSEERQSTGMMNHKDKDFTRKEY